MIIILDTNIILRYPKLLGVQNPEYSLVVTSEVLDELNESAKKVRIEEDFFTLIKMAEKVGNISIFNSDLPEVLNYEEKLKHVFGKVDKSLITTALFFKAQQSKKVKIATLDREVQNVARNNSIDIITNDELKQLFIEDIEQSKPLSKNIQKFEKSQRNGYWISLVSAVLATFVAVRGYDNIRTVVSTINIWGTVLLFIIIGVALFILREKQRLGYGIFEFLIGVTAIVLLFEPSKFEYNRIIFNMDFSVKLIGGLYIMVRGQDNIVKALKNKKLGIILREKFGIGE